MVSKKATRKLKKSKKLQPTKPLLSLNFTKIEQTSTLRDAGSVLQRPVTYRQGGTKMATKAKKTPKLQQEKLSAKAPGPLTLIFQLRKPSISLRPSWMADASLAD